MARKQSGNKTSSLASAILAGRIKQPTSAQAKALAASILSQDETRGRRPESPSPKKTR